MTHCQQEVVLLSRSSFVVLPSCTKIVLQTHGNIKRDHIFETGVSGIVPRCICICNDQIIIAMHFSHRIKVWQSLIFRLHLNLFTSKVALIFRLYLNLFTSKIIFAGKFIPKITCNNNDPTKGTWFQWYVQY